VRSYKKGKVRWVKEIEERQREKRRRDIQRTEGGR
jgi:hypothetical protein